MPFFGNMDFCFNPVHDFHSRESHEDKHDNGKNQCKNNIYHHFLYPVVAVNERCFLSAIQVKRMYGFPVIVLNDQLIVLQFQVFFPPCFFKLFEFTKKSHVVGFFFKVRVFLIDNLETAETFFQHVRAELPDCLVDTFVFCTGSALQECADSYDKKAQKKGREKVFSYFVHCVISLRDSMVLYRLQANIL